MATPLFIFVQIKGGVGYLDYLGVSNPPRSTSPLYRLVIPLRCSSVCLCTCENRFWRSEKVCIISTDPGDDRPGIWRSSDPWGIVDSWSDSWCLWIFHPPTSLAPSRPLLGMVDEMFLMPLFISSQKMKGLDPSITQIFHRGYNFLYSTWSAVPIEQGFEFSSLVHVIFWRCVLSTLVSDFLVAADSLTAGFCFDFVEGIRWVL